MRTFSSLLGGMLLLAVNTTQASYRQIGAGAIEDGNRATALADLRPLAEQGNAYAQNNLGVIYDLGRGVPQDYVQASS